MFNKKSNAYSKLAVLFITAFCLAMPANSFAAAGGFVDAQIATGESFQNTNGAGNSPTFRVNDGAIYLSKELGNGSAMVDIPFAVGSATANTFTIATGKAQAYVAWKYDFGMNWAIGQWDTLYGIDKNDSINNRFSTQGRIFSALIPVTYTGGLIGYKNGGIEVKGFVANNSTQGLRNGKNFEYGTALKFTHDTFWAQAGATIYKERLNSENRTLVDLTAGATFGAMSVDAEIVLNKAATAGADMGFAALGQFGYDINSTWNVACRGEFLSKATANNSEILLMAGPAAKMTEDFRVKLDYSLHSVKVVSGGTSTTSHFGGLSGIYKF